MTIETQLDDARLANATLREKLRRVIEERDELQQENERLKTCPICERVDPGGLEACSACYNSQIAAATKKETARGGKSGTLIDGKMIFADNPFIPRLIKGLDESDNEYKRRIIDDGRKEPTYDCRGTRARDLVLPLDLANPAASTMEEIAEALTKVHPDCQFYVVKQEDGTSALSYKFDATGVSTLEVIEAEETEVIDKE